MWWKYALLGGAGGLAAPVCQFLAMFLPNLFAGEAATQRALQTLPSTPLMLFIFFVVFLTVFVIAAGVVYFTLDRRQAEGAATRAFLLGVSVPSLIISMGHGLSSGTASQQAMQNSPPSSVVGSLLEDPQSQAGRLWAASFTAFDIRPVYVAAANDAGGVRVSVSCPDCPGGLDLASVVNQIVVTGPAGKTVIDAQGATLGDWNPLSSKAGSIVVTIPAHSSKSPANPQIWRSGKTHFLYKDGERWIINVTVRQGVWNNIRAFFALNAYYVIESVTPAREAPQKSRA